MNKKIIQVYEQLDLGGRQMAILALAKDLLARGWDVQVVSFIPGGLEKLFTDNGIHVHILPKGPKYQRIPALCRYFRKHQPAVVHTHLFSAGFWGRISAKLANVPVIIHTEGGMPFEDKRWKRVPAERLLTRISDRVICVAQAIKDHLTDVGGLRANALMVIPNGLSADALLTHPLEHIGDSPTLFSAGRLAHVKGYDLLIRAFAQLQHFHGRLVLAGDGPQGDELRDLCHSLGVQDRVEFLGYRDDVRALLTRSDLYITPSRSEGMSNSILEAMAAGVPVIATDVGGNRELLGNAGRVVPAEDPTALANAITEAITHKEQTLRLAKMARARVQSTYTLDRIVSAHEALYEHCLIQKGVTTT